MSHYSVYKCDLCGKNINDHDVYTLSIVSPSKREYIKPMDICKECADRIETTPIHSMQERMNDPLYIAANHPVEYEKIKRMCE